MQGIFSELLPEIFFPGMIPGAVHKGGPQDLGHVGGSQFKVSPADGGPVGTGRPHVVGDTEGLEQDFVEEAAEVVLCDAEDEGIARALRAAAGIYQVSK